MASATPNVLLVTVDCLRRDRLSAYGYERATTPFLDSLLDDALHCTSAHSASSWTCPSVVSLLTGQYPHRHGAGLIPGDPKHLRRDNLPTVLDEHVPLIPNLLSQATSAAFLAVWNAGLSMPDRFPFVDSSEGSDGALVTHAVRWMNRQQTPFFCWLHLKGPHDPLDVPRGDRDAFGQISSYRSARRWRFQRREDDVSGDDFREYLDDRVCLYDAAVRVADGSVRDVWGGLDPATRTETILVVTADHGEELWEHREEEIEHFEDPRNVFGVGHGHNLFQEHLLVPLIMTGPGIPSKRIEENVSLVDVVPTVLAASGLQSPPDAAAAFDGMSLLEPIPSERPVLAEGIAYGRAKTAVIQGDLKLLSSAGDGYERIFVLGERDRKETPADAGETAATALRKLIPPDENEGGVQVKETAEIASHLAELGYVEE
jgi:arylsulfatase A-like enzyme